MENPKNENVNRIFEKVKIEDFFSKSLNSNASLNLEKVEI
jgi:hypothetical protein